MVPPYILGKLMFDRVLDPVVPTPQAQRMKLLFILLGLSFLAHAIHLVIRIFQGRIAVGVGASVSRDLRARLFNHLETLSLGYFDRHKTGALMSRVSSDTRMLQGFLVDGVQWTIISVLQVLVVSVILFSIHWRMALILILTAPLMIIFTKTIWRRIISLFRRLWEVVSRMSATLNDSLRGIRVVKAFGREQQEIDRFGRRNEAVFEALVRAEQTMRNLAQSGALQGDYAEIAANEAQNLRTAVLSVRGEAT